MPEPRAGACARGREGDGTMTRLSASVRVRGFCWGLARVWLVCLWAGLTAPARGQDRGPGAEAGKPHVIRTIVHHQITSGDRGISPLVPLVSDNGNRIVFGLSGAADGRPPRLAAVDFDGGNLAVLDEGTAIAEQDTTANGSRVVYITNYH